MAGKNKVMVFLFLCCAGTMIVPFIASCGKSGTSVPSGSAILFQVVNLSPDLQPVNLYMGNFQQGSFFSYPNPSGYFSLANIDTPIRIKSSSSLISNTNFIALDTIVKANLRYTLYVTGLRADSTVTSIFTVDTTANPTPGRGKIRFVNASLRSTGLDVSANGTMAFTNCGYKSVSKFIEIPPGNYDFKIMPTGLTTVISTLQAFTIADGKIYTMYCRGIANGADSVAFGAGILSNK